MTTTPTPGRTYRTNIAGSIEAEDHAKLPKMMRTGGALTLLPGTYGPYTHLDEFRKIVG